jgi:hypothetical protein
MTRDFSVSFREHILRLERQRLAACKDLIVPWLELGKWDQYPPQRRVIMVAREGFPDSLVTTSLQFPWMTFGGFFKEGSIWHWIFLHRRKWENFSDLVDIAGRLPGQFHSLSNDSRVCLGDAMGYVNDGTMPMANASGVRRILMLTIR